MNKRLFRTKALEKLASPDQLDELMTVIRPSGWVVLLSLSGLLAALLVWASLATIQTNVSGQGILTTQNSQTGHLEGVLYLELSDGQHVKPGMVVKLAPLSVRQEEHGLLLGEVLAVEYTPSDTQSMQRVLQNDALAQSLINTGALIAVRVRLHQTEGTASGYQWTSASGPPAPLSSGTVASGEIVVAEQRPISLLFPNLL